jgi:hypothetical protein
MSELDGIAFDAADALRDTWASAGIGSLGQLGVDDRRELVDQVNGRAVAYARDRAAELVGRRFNAAGDLVDNPDADWSIDDGTRDMLRDVITDGLADNLGADEIAEQIAGSFAFSAERADMIARTEIARANSAGSIASYRIARDEADVDVKKAWILGDNPCAICQENADAGAIDLDDEFPSGDDAAPAHPNCECAVTPVVGDDED